MTYAKFCELLPVLDCDRSRKAIWMRMKPTDKKQVAPVSLPASLSASN